MKQLTAVIVTASLVTFSIAGCSDTAKSSVKQETKTSTPTGTTTVTTEKEVKQTGEKPPATTP